MALCLDLSLRQQGKTTLDAVMRALWSRCLGTGLSENDLLAVLQDLSTRSFAKEIASWVHSTTELPLKPLLQAQGLRVLEDAAPDAEQLGLRFVDGGQLRVKSVLRGSAAEQAGFAAGDEWIGLSVGSGKSQSAWQLTKLDDIALYAGTAKRVGAWVARDRRLLSLTLTRPPTLSNWRLVAGERKRVRQWLETEL